MLEQLQVGAVGWYTLKTCSSLVCGSKDLIMLSGFLKGEKAMGRMVQWTLVTTILVTGEKRYHHQGAGAVTGGWCRVVQF